MGNKLNIKPNGLKGREQINKMLSLMDAPMINESLNRSSVELTKIGPDGVVYGIVREGHDYYIKTTNKKNDIKLEDFSYIGGLKNKREFVYESYAKAIKQLNLKFISLNESLNKNSNINTFKNDNLLTEHHPYKADQKLSTTKGMGDSGEYVVDKNGKPLSYDAKEGKISGQFGDNVADKDVDDEFEKVTLSENEMAIDEILMGLDEEEEINIPEKGNNNSFSIEKSLNELDNAIPDDCDEEINELYESLNENQKKSLFNKLNSKKKI